MTSAPVTVPCSVIRTMGTYAAREPQLTVATLTVFGLAQKTAALTTTITHWIAALSIQGRITAPGLMVCAVSWIWFLYRANYRRFCNKNAQTSTV